MDCFTFFSDVHGSRMNLLKRLKRWSIGFFILNLSVSILRPSLNWADTLTDPQLNQTLLVIATLTPFPIKIVNWQYLIAEVFCRHVPFFLTQQIYILVVLICGALSHALEHLLSEITASTNLINSNEREGHKCGNPLLLMQQVRKWTTLHAHLMIMISRLNGTFGFLVLSVLLPRFSGRFGLHVTTIWGNNVQRWVHCLSLLGFAWLRSRNWRSGHFTACTVRRYLWKGKFMGFIGMWPMDSRKGPSSLLVL